MAAHNPCFLIYILNKQGTPLLRLRVGKPYKGYSQRCEQSVDTTRAWNFVRHFSLTFGFRFKWVRGGMGGWEVGNLVSWMWGKVQLQRGIFSKSMLPLFALLSSDDRPGLSFSNYQNTPAPPES